MPGPFVLRPARPDEAAALTALTLRSKAHWGYDPGFLDACRAELTVRPADCDGRRVVVAENGALLLGYYRLAGSPPRGELADLFVDPRRIGTGLGKALLRHARGQAASAGMRDLAIDSDPHAEGFYLHAGAVRAGTVPSGAVPGRELPRLVIPTVAPAGRPGPHPARPKPESR